MRFSQRMGYVPIKNMIQTDSMDQDLRIGLWNVFSVVWKQLDSAQKEKFSYLLWESYFKQPIDEIPFDVLYRRYDYNTIYNSIKDYFMKSQWMYVYDFLEFCALLFTSNFTDNMNEILERELSGYRFINKLLVPITEEVEIESIEDAEKSGFPSVTTHIQTAVKLLSDRKKPDYRNSIKESISAVEAMCQIVSNNPKATLGDALKIIEKSGKLELHPCLKTAFDKLYGYTSDNKTGIRHALMDESNIGFEDAKFMLISCSAFINYLKEKMSK